MYFIVFKSAVFKEAQTLSKYTTATKAESIYLDEIKHHNYNVAKAFLTTPEARLASGV
jgi:hypothetical protein